MRQFEIPFSGEGLKQKLLHWAAKHPFCVFLDSCNTEIDRYGNYDFLIGISTNQTCPRFQNLQSLESAISEKPFAWRFGVFGYELKKQLNFKPFVSLPTAIEFPEMYFFEADIVIAKRKGSKWLSFEIGYSETIFEEIQNTNPENYSISGFDAFVSNFTQQSYQETIDKLRSHIKAGDSYEINLSQNFVATVSLTHPEALWEKMIAVSPTPFAGFAKWEHQYLLCASPERFLQLRSGRLLTQPIKGTIARGKDAKEDQQNSETLRNSEKERAENVMIVDLSRNDLYRSSEVNSVQVPHLFEVQRFPQVLHLVSTITGQKRKDLHPIHAIRNAFPPGSMTGAPKAKTCELISKYEMKQRGIYAGSFGYFAPGGDFDLNVVIRSLVYDAKTEVLSYHVGGAITWDSDPKAEFEETLLKAKGIAALF